MKRIAAAFAAAVLCLLAFSAPAHASTLTIRQVDTTAWPIVRIVVLAGGNPGLQDFNVRDGGRLVSDLAVLPLVRTATAVGTVLTLDESGSMAAGGRIEAAKAAAASFVDHMSPAEQVAIIAFSNEVRLVAGFTSDHAALHKAIDELRAHGETALWDGVSSATGLLQARPDLQPNIIVLTDGKDTTSKASAADARAAAVAVKAVVFGVGLGAGGDVDAGPLTSLASATGGRYLAAPSATQLPNVYAAVQSALQGQYELSYRASAGDARDLMVSVGGEQATASVVPGALSRGVNTRPQVVSPPRAPGFLSGVFGKLLIMAMAFVTIALAAWAVVMTVTRPRSELTTVLAPYGDGSTAEDIEERVGVSFANTELMRKAIDSASRFAPFKSVVAWVDARLELANVPMRAAEALFAYGAALLVFGALALLLKGPTMAFGVLILLTMAPLAALKFKAGQRRRRFLRQLPDALKLLSGTLRAGYSLMQGVEALAAEVGDPMGEELRRVLAEARLARPLGEALEDMATRLKSPDFEWTVMAIEIQREVGGNLAELLETVAETMVARERLRRDVKALTAEGRVSAFVIGVLPALLAAVMWVVNPTYISVLFTNPTGQKLAVASGLLAMFGFWWMKKTIEIEV